jgi:IS30 family transposase
MGTKKLNLSSLNGNRRPASVGRFAANPVGVSLGFTIEDAKEMQRLHDSGWTQALIAQQFGCDQSTVSDWLRRNSCSENGGDIETIRTSSSGKLTCPEREEIESLLALGVEISDVMARTGRGKTTVHNVLNKNDNVQILRKESLRQQRRLKHEDGRRRRDDSPEIVRRVVSAVRRSKGLAEAAREAGMSESKIVRILEDHRPDLLRLATSRSVSGNMVGNNTNNYRHLEQTFKQRFLQYTVLVEDYGVEQVEQWYAEFEADRQALARIMKDMRETLDYAQSITTDNDN